jgi:hypothetical protein
MAKYVLRAIQFTTLSIAAGTLTLKLAIAQNVDLHRSNGTKSHQMKLPASTGACGSKARAWTI